MRQIAGIAIGDHIYRYPGITYQTDCGILLSFQNGSHKWDGIYPGMSWDEFYNDLVLMNIEPITLNRVQKLIRYPLFIWPFKPVGVCQKADCKQNTSAKYCSIHCWYFDTLEATRYAIENASSLDVIDYNVRFVERLAAKFGPLVELSCNSHSAGELVVGLLPVSPLDL